MILGDGFISKEKCVSRYIWGDVTLTPDEAGNYAPVNVFPLVGQNIIKRPVALLLGGIAVNANNSTATIIGKYGVFTYLVLFGLRVTLDSSPINYGIQLSPVLGVEKSTPLTISLNPGENLGPLTVRWALSDSFGAFASAIGQPQP